MITEIAQIEVTPGSEQAFEAGVAQAVDLFRTAPGCRHMRLERSLEFTGRYRLFVAWDTVDHHMVDFRASPAFARWRELVGPHFAAPPSVEHTQSVIDGF